MQCCNLLILEPGFVPNISRRTVARGQMAKQEGNNGKTESEPGCLGLLILLAILVGIAFLTGPHDGGGHGSHGGHGRPDRDDERRPEPPRPRPVRPTEYLATQRTLASVFKVPAAIQHLTVGTPPSVDGTGEMELAEACILVERVGQRGSPTSVTSHSLQ
jgi:hypothetical protein